MQSPKAIPGIYARPGTHERVRSIDYAEVAAAGDVLVSATLVDDTSGMDSSCIKYVRTPPGKGSPNGFHEHEFEQTFYVLEGVMTVQFEGEDPFELEAGDAVVFPAGVRHRNWNAGVANTVHLSFCTPYTSS